MKEEEFECLHSILKSFESYSTELCSKGSVSDICGCFNELLKRADELKKDHDEYLDRPCESIKVSFISRELEESLDMTCKNVVGQIQGIFRIFKTTSNL